MLVEFFHNLLTLANAMSFYILIGLLIAGVLKQLIPENFISSHLGGSSTSSVIKATIFGIPIPVCSCSVIPLAKSLQKEGASRGSVQSFLISAPITGVDSIAATYSFFGIFFTIYRVITSIIIAITTGLIQNIFDSNKDNKPKSNIDLTPYVANKNINSFNFVQQKSCCSSKKQKKTFSTKEVFAYAYGTLFKDIALSLLIGLVIGALFTTILPKELLHGLTQYQFLTYIAVLIIAMPLYVCATASLPIAGAFILSGMSGGAAFIFLSAGPATNSVTMGVVKEMFGFKALLIYLGSISILSILFGYIFDNISDKIDVLDIGIHMEHYSYLDTFSSVIMMSLIVYYLLKPKLLKNS
jgi:uncharacterized membrane protein YraQ (UPF0718 family)